MMVPNRQDAAKIRNGHGQLLECCLPILSSESGIYYGSSSASPIESGNLGVYKALDATAQMQRIRKDVNGRDVLSSLEAQHPRGQANEERDFAFEFAARCRIGQANAESANFFGKRKLGASVEHVYMY